MRIKRFVRIQLVGLWCSAIVAGTATVAKADISIVPTTNAVELINALTATGAEGIQVLNVRLQAHRNSVASSCGLYNLSGPIPDTYGLSFPGIVLSTGNVADYASGTNRSTAQSTSFNVRATEEQETLLDPITGPVDHYDCTQLDITFRMLPGHDTVFFQVVFGTEEYPEFVNSTFVDGFGMYLNGTNIAFLAERPINVRHPAMRALAGTELDGLIASGGTAVLTFGAFVGSGTETNTLTFILADSSDAAVDTTVYIAALGGGTPPQPPPIPPPPPPPPPGGPCVTRSADFWFEHAFGEQGDCVSLLEAIKANNGGLHLGFMQLPTAQRNGDGVLNAEDTLIEALGFWWKNTYLTGENDGTQSARASGSALCRVRKRMAREIIAGIANQMLFRTNP
ncbi:MAG: choice-of-anchor L domain-containing protein, partial [Verrucomicrobiae bacterium]|nr:choice-of-anchor L domain-containing protein [Verrucomicrobiae bacterium]